MALMVALAIGLITLVSSYFFWAQTWWFPIDISTHGPAIDRQFMVTLAICGVIFLLAQFGLAWAVWRYRDRADGRRATYSHGNNRLEAGWTIAAAILFIGLNLMGYRVWAGVHFVGAAPGALQIEVTGQQFQWFFRYPGVDGQFGPTRIEKIDDAAGNSLGLDRDKDAASKDDVVTVTLGIPVNREVQLMLRSKDVTHSFFVRELRLKQDTVPGMVIPIHFTANQTGTYELACTELCGLGHYRMRAFLRVMPEAEFADWLQKEAEGQ
jgi:cytochrome c oxidase subunit 2